MVSGCNDGLKVEEAGGPSSIGIGVREACGLSVWVKGETHHTIRRHMWQVSSLVCEGGDSLVWDLLASSQT